jgi:hypothetical protein
MGVILGIFFADSGGWVEAWRNLGNGWVRVARADPWISYDFIGQYGSTWYPGRDAMSNKWGIYRGAPQPNAYEIWLANVGAWSTLAEAQAAGGGGGGGGGGAPATVTGLQVLSTDPSGTAVLDWADNAPSSDSAVQVIGYVVSVASDPSGPWVDQPTRPTASQYTLTGLPSPSTRYVRVAGVNALGIQGSPSATATVSIPTSGGGTGGASFVSAADSIGGLIVDWPLEEASGSTFASRVASPAMPGTLRGAGATYRQAGPISDSPGALDLNGTAYVEVADDDRLTPANLSVVLPVRVDTLASKALLRKDGEYFATLIADGSVYCGVWVGDGHHRGRVELPHCVDVGRHDARGGDLDGPQGRRDGQARERDLRASERHIEHDERAADRVLCRFRRHRCAL